MEWNIRRYTPADRKIWDEFVRQSRNSTFLFERGYMDYHSDCFRDCSWMAFKGTRLLAILPANIDSEMVLHSHQGLTYGGWILPPIHLDGADLLDIFRTAVEIWEQEGIVKLDYKPVPWIYSSQPSDEDIYALFRLGGKITEVNLSSTIDLNGPLRYNKLRKRTLKNVSDLNCKVIEMDDARCFMSIVEQCLKDRHDALPVHSAGEIELLRNRFPNNIKLYGVKYQEGIEAVVMIFDTGRVAHAQYIATTPLGRDLNLLTPLFNFLITGPYVNHRFFDFGTSNEDHGRYLNEGLLRQKFSYGATGVAYQRFELEL